LPPLLAVAAALVCSFVCFTRADAAPVGQTLEPPPRLVRSQTDVFLVAGRFRRWVVSPQVFTDYRFSEAWVERITDDELTRIPRGPDLVAGPALRDAENHVWIVYQGTRRRVIGEDAYAPLYLSPNDAVPASQEMLLTYPIGRSAGNPPRPWMLAVVGGFALAATAILAIGLFATGQGASGRWIAAIAIGGVALKLVFVSLYPWLVDGADGQAYETLARYLMAGGSLMQDGPNRGLAAVTSPGYPMILALFSGAVTLTRDNVIGWKLVQVGIAGSVALVVADLASQLYGRRGGWVAMIIASVSPIWFLAADVLQYEIWLGCLLAGAVWALFRAEESARRRWWWIALAGGLLGIAVMVQLKVAVVASLCAAYLLLPRLRRRRHWITSGLLPAALLTIISATPVMAWGVRNVVVHGEFLLGSTGPAPMLWAGNHLGATGGYMQLPRPDRFYDVLRRFPEDSLTREARAFATLGWEVIRAHPSHFGTMALIKLERFWWTLSPDRYGEFTEGRTVSFLGGVMDARALLFASKLLNTATLITFLAGLLGGWRLRVAHPAARRAAVDRRRWMVIVVVVAFWLVHIPFISEPRYRIGIAPLIQVLQAAGVVVLGRALHSRVSRRASQ